MRKKKRGLGKGVVTAGVVTAVLFAGFLLAGTFLPDDVIAKNVICANINLSGMTEEEAFDALSNINPYEGITVGIKANGYDLELKGEDVSLNVDAKMSAKKAYEIGKSKNIFKNSVDFFRLLFSDIELGAIPVSDEKALSEVLYNLGVKANGEFVDYNINVENGIATVTPRIAGQNPDTSKAMKEVYRCIENGQFKDIEVSLDRSDDKPITIDELYDMLNREAEDAEYVYEGNKVSVKEHVLGLKTDREKIGKAVEKLNSGMNAELEVEAIEAELTTDILKNKLFNTTLASYTTSYSTGAANRAANVELAASKINGKVLKPGEEFSYNETIGDTTLENGYKVAPVYENGKESTGVGGGICQVSSTLYSAVLYADLNVTQRRNHSLTVAYVPKGQDATVSYGAIDFKFKNNMDYPVKIVSVAGGGTVTVSIVGTKRDVNRKVEISHSVVSTTSPVVNETLDPTLPVNTKRVVVSGKTGYVVDTYKTIYENGEKVSSEKITRSTYKMMPTEMLVGSKAEENVSADVTEETEETPTDIPSSAEVEEEALEIPKSTEAPAKEETQEIVRPTKAPEI